VADLQLRKYIKSSAQIFQKLDSRAFSNARQFYRTPSPHTLTERRASGSLAQKLIKETRGLPTEVHTERKAVRPRTPWLTENASRPSETRERSADLVTPMGKLKNLDSLISDITNTSVKNKSLMSSSIRLGKQKYSRLKELLRLTEDEDLMQFKE
jgi:hypothetical protein